MGSCGYVVRLQGKLTWRSFALGRQLALSAERFHLLMVGKKVPGELDGHEPQN
jgi:hypothetical protein